MPIRFSTSSTLTAILSIAFIAGSMFSVSVSAGDSSKKSNNKGSSAIFLPTAFEVQAADFIIIEESFLEQTSFTALTFARTRTPVSVSDPTTGEPIDNLGENNFTVDQLAAQQACGFTAPPEFQPPTAFTDKPFDFDVTNLGNGFYTVDLLPTTSEGCVGSGFPVAIQIRISDGIRKGQTAGLGFVNGPFCSGSNCPISF